MENPLSVPWRCRRMGCSLVGFVMAVRLVMRFRVKPNSVRSATKAALGLFYFGLMLGSLMFLVPAVLQGGEVGVIWAYMVAAPIVLFSVGFCAELIRAGFAGSDEGDESERWDSRFKIAAISIYAVSLTAAWLLRP